MEGILNQKELRTATQIIGVALLKARSSMEMILQTPIDIKRIDYSLEDGLYENSYQDTNEIYVIKTELMGELSGACHLLFSDHEVNRIQQECLPKSIIEDTSEQSKIMKDGFLTEMDNMVSAAVISSLSDLLGINFYGNVPTMDVIESPLVDLHIEKEATHYDTVVHFKALFHSQKLKVSPHFFWMVHEDILELIKNKI